MLNMLNVAIKELGAEYDFRVEKNEYLVYKKCNLDPTDNTVSQGLVLKDYGYNIIEIEYIIDRGDTLATVYYNSLLSHNVKSDTVTSLIEDYEEKGDKNDNK